MSSCEEDVDFFHSMLFQMVQESDPQHGTGENPGDHGFPGAHLFLGQSISFPKLRASPGFPPPSLRKTCFRRNQEVPSLVPQEALF